MVPDDSLTIRQRAIAAWPTAWGGQNQRDILVSLGYDVDTPWRDLPKKARQWILFTEDQPVVPVYAGLDPHEARRALKRKDEPSYHGTFTSARRYVFHTFAHTQSARMKKRVSEFMRGADCPACGGKRLRRESLSVTFAGLDITEPIAPADVAAALHPGAVRRNRSRLRRPTATVTRNRRSSASGSQLTSAAACRCCSTWDWATSTLDRSTPTLSPGELQRLRLATQVHSNLFGVVYVLDEPSAGLHPADTESLLRALSRLESRRQLALRRRAQPGRGAPRGLDRRRGTCGRRTRRARALQRSARRAGDRSSSRARAHLFQSGAGACGGRLARRGDGCAS